jgi:hypothetical protein
MIKNIISRLTMIKGTVHYYDKVTKYKVYTWTDCYFNKYAAATRFGMRIKLNN